MLSDQLINDLGLLHLRPKSHKTAETQPVSAARPGEAPTPKSQPKLDKSEFRLLVKMLQAINHACEYDAIDYDGQIVKYKHPNKTLVFHDINTSDNDDVMNLTSLTDLLKFPETKRAVWEKLKTLQPR